MLVRPFYLLPYNDRPALSDSRRTLTYKQLIDEVTDYRIILNDKGYTKDHRICVQGTNRVETWCWMIAASMEGCGTALPLGATKFTEEGRLERNNANLLIRLHSDGYVTSFEHRHFDKTVEQEKEYMCQYSSGTSDRHGIPKCYSGVYELDENNWGGDGRQSMAYRKDANPDFCNPETNRFLNHMHPFIPWAQDVVYHTLQMGGWVHCIRSVDEWDEGCDYQKPTWTIGFPLHLDRIMDTNKGHHKINTLEFTGGIVTRETQDKWQQFFDPDQFINCYGEGSVGTYLVNVAKKGEDCTHVGQQVLWHQLSGGEVRIGENQTVEVRGLNTPNGEWWDSGDIAEMDGDNYRIIGRANEVIIHRGGANIFPQEIADHLSKHPDVDDCYVYKLNDRPACVYSGNIDAESFGQWANNEIEKHQQIIKFTRVRDKMTALQKTPNPKVNTFFMAEVLEENPEWTLETYS